ncbi:MAG: hypothetical protein QXI16_06255 [Sulfolobaceae archaeon]
MIKTKFTLNKDSYYYYQDCFFKCYWSKDKGGLVVSEISKHEFITALYEYWLYLVNIEKGGNDGN